MMSIKSIAALTLNGDSASNVSEIKFLEVDSPWTGYWV